MSTTQEIKAGYRVRVIFNEHGATGDGWLTPLGSLGTVRRVDGGQVSVLWDANKTRRSFGCFVGIASIEPAQEQMEMTI